MTRWKMTTLLIVVLAVTGMKSQADVRPDKRPTLDREAILRELQAAVKAGKITDAQAKEKLAALEKGAKTPDEKPTRDWEAIVRELKAAVEAGKMTEEETWAKFYELRKGSEGIYALDRGTIHD